ncbi:aldehyde dehydrogenase family protein [Viridibacillus sp. FSL R5-0477]|uniref:Betaine aldehyde dehydrogenase n=1 Tax=Viridibacillus arenosi FSL R5-213 TaxID=1227360 RepID=W4EMT6_9BACL|nr:aldehyde dehydrogenase family protein [Viridibacillus arenosi]ETT81554.1 betaine aldehyde dehydrogenase [Viridibacillus arenosi FSL R5-213]OMC89748.1 aldehyde dehydrogenase [Viridibacillus arenosi]
MKRISMLINGKWVGDDSNEWLPVFNPSNGELIAEIVKGKKEHVDEAVHAAQVAFESDEWKKVKPYERGQLLVRLAAHIRNNAEQWSKWECEDVGKPISQAKADVEAAARYFEFYGGAADKVMGDTIPIEEGILNATVLEPVGVTAHIVPWNYPLQITARSVAAAIATGNAVIVKSAEDTPLTTHAIAEWFAESELPKGIFQHVTGLGADVGGPLAGHPGIHHITFTGSVNTGISVMKAAAENVVPVTLELGGKSPNIVFADANEELALEGIVRAIIQNAGQTCSAGSRLLIEEKYKDHFLRKLTAKFNELTIGPGIDDREIGPILNKKQFDQIINKIQDAKPAGNIIAGGESVTISGSEGGYYIQPTIIDGLDNNHPLAKEEIFGPVLTVFTFETIEEAIALANSTDYGLVAGIWTRNIDVAHYVASKVKSGQVFINNYGAAGGVQMPFGGYKKSGIGREKGFIALRNYTQVKNIAVKFSI